MLGDTGEDSSIIIELRVFRDGAKGFNFSEVISQTLNKSAIKLGLRSNSESLDFQPSVSVLQQIELKVERPKVTPEGETFQIVGSNPGLLTTFVNPTTSIATNYFLVETEPQEV